MAHGWLHSFDDASPVQHLRFSTAETTSHCVWAIPRRNLWTLADTAAQHHSFSTCFSILSGRVLPLIVSFRSCRYFFFFAGLFFTAFLAVAFLLVFAGPPPPVSDPPGSTIFLPIVLLTLLVFSFKILELFYQNMTFEDVKNFVGNVLAPFGAGVEQLRKRFIAGQLGCFRPTAQVFEERAVRFPKSLARPLDRRGVRRLAPPSTLLRCALGRAASLVRPRT